MRRSHVAPIAVIVLAPLCIVVVGVDQTPAQTPAPEQQKPTRRSQRIKMPDVQVASPDGRITFAMLPNAERLTFTVSMDKTTVIDPSPVVFTLDGYDLS